MFSILLMYLIRVLDCYRYCTNTVDSQNMSTESSGLLEVIVQITAHDSMLACDRPSQGTPVVVKALVMAQNQRS
jgi:hypothetical protein